MSKHLYFFLSVLMGTSIYAQHQLTHVDRTIPRRCYITEKNKTIILASTSKDYVPSDINRNGVYNDTLAFEVFLIDTNLRIEKRYKLNDLLPSYSFFTISNTLLNNNEIVITGSGSRGASSVHFTGILNVESGVLTLTDEYVYPAGDILDFDPNPFYINDSLMGVLDYLFPSENTILHLINEKGEVSTEVFSGDTLSPLPFYSQINTDSTIYLKDANFEINVFDVNNLKFTQNTSRQYLASLPNGSAVRFDSLYYMFGCWLGVDEDGFYQQGWTPSRAYDLFLYTYDSEFNLLERKEFTDRAWFQQHYTQVFRTQNYVLEDSLLKVVYTSFPDETATGNSDFMTGEKFENSKLTFATVDLNGNMLSKEDYFENDGRNHFNWFIHKNRRGYLLVNTVLDVADKPDTTTNLELMQLDENGLVLGVKTIGTMQVNKIAVYPNPARSNGAINLSWSGMVAQSWVLQLFNNHGQLVYNTNITQAQKEVQIQLPNLTIGTYHLRATGSQKQVHTGTVLIE